MVGLAEKSNSKGMTLVRSQKSDGLKDEMGFSILYIESGSSVVRLGILRPSTSI